MSDSETTQPGRAGALADIPDTMKALILHGPNEFSIETMPTPQPKGDEVLCRVKAVAICGTDPKIVAGKFPGMWPPSFPALIGHEWAGEVVALSDDLKASPRSLRSTPSARGSPARRTRAAASARTA